uniref:Uncharacterized protein n=1 Tax=Arion vulgaris TaxID=1028688 RepID=A0A0B7BA95_9EUPU
MLVPIKVLNCNLEYRKHHTFEELTAKLLEHWSISFENKGLVSGMVKVLVIVQLQPV